MVGVGGLIRVPGRRSFSVCVVPRVMRIRPAPKANVAQLVEQLTRNEQVSGSSPLIGSTSKRPS